jgi:Uma2 family endonuclease
MRSAPRSTRPPTRKKEIPSLENGDHLDQKTFHERYKAMPEHVRAELIGGIVYMPSPLKPPHGRADSDVIWWLNHYRMATPGTDNVSNTTQILGPRSEPQPDACLFILPEHGGQVWFDDEGYLAGAPELVAEISSSTESIDLHAKKSDYEKAGVQEYVVTAMRRGLVYWFVRHRGKFKELTPDADGIYRSPRFAGLWLDPAALLRRDTKRLLQVLDEGLASAEHAAFVEKLQRGRK